MVFLLHFSVPLIYDDRTEVLYSMMRTKGATKHSGLVNRYVEPNFSYFYHYQKVKYMGHLYQRKFVLETKRLHMFRNVRAEKI